MMLMRDGARSGLATIILDREMLPNLLQQWQDLCKRSAEDNVYYAPHYMLPLLRSVAARQDVRIITVWNGDRLIALLPVVMNRAGVPGIRPAGKAFRTDYTFSCMPLLDKAEVDVAAAAVFDALAILGKSEWSLPQVNVDGCVCTALQRALQRRNAPFAVERSFERASLSAGASFEEHMKSHVSAKRRRDLARNRRRLEELGSVTHRTETSGKGLVEAVEIFLTLEASGWKGARGTALSCSPDTRTFAEQAFGPASGDGASRVDLLVLDGKPIAAGVIVFSGTTGFTVKGAYDEAFANYGAGLLLEQEVIRCFLTERWADRLDAATNGNHVIDFLWPDRVRVGDLVFSLASTGAALRLKSLTGINQRAVALKASLKTAMKR